MSTPPLPPSASSPTGSTPASLAFAAPTPPPASASAPVPTPAPTPTPASASAPAPASASTPTPAPASTLAPAPASTVSTPAAVANSPVPSASFYNVVKPRPREPSNPPPPASKRIKVEHAASSPSTPKATAPAAIDFGAPNATPHGRGNADAGKSTATGPGGTLGAKPASQVQAGGGDGRENFDSLVDVMGASGVDLRAEEEAIQQRELYDHSSSNAVEAQGDQDGELYLQVYPLAFKVHTIAQKHGLGVDAAVLNYLSLAARTRFRNILESMISSSRHRSWSSHQHPPPFFDGDERRPMYHETILSDPRKQLAALERAERGDEARRRKERLARDEEAASLVPGGGAEAGDGDAVGESSVDGAGTPRPAGSDGKRKPKKVGPGVAARNMSEDVQKRLANSTAMRNLGGSASKYSWLQGGGAFAGSMPSPLHGKGKAKAELVGEGGDAGDGGGGTPSRLPKPKFAPQPSALASWKTGKLGEGALAPLSAGGGDSGEPGGSVATTAATGGAASKLGAASLAAGTGAWGDVTARQAAREEEERQERLQVTLRDALFALEYERSGAVGHGSGEAILYRARARASKAA